MVTECIFANNEFRGITKLCPKSALDLTCLQVKLNSSPVKGFERAQRVDEGTAEYFDNIWSFPERKYH